MTPDYITRFRKRLYANWPKLLTHPLANGLPNWLQGELTTLATEQFEAGKVAGRSQAVSYILLDPDILGLEEEWILAAVSAHNSKSV